MYPKLLVFPDLRTQWKGVLFGMLAYFCCALYQLLRCVQFSTNFRGEPSAQEVSPESLVTCFS